MKKHRGEEGDLKEPIVLLFSGELKKQQEEKEKNKKKRAPTPFLFYQMLHLNMCIRGFLSFDFDFDFLFVSKVFVFNHINQNK